VFDVDPLFETIDPMQSSYTILSTKIEVKLHKATTGKKWADLEGTQAESAPQDKPEATAPTTPAALPVYPTSSKSGPKDWDKVATELTKKEKKSKGKGKEEEPGPGDGEEDSDVEGGDPVNHFFKKLYASADEDTRRAMMKSYVESNGTALSTDWKEVKKGKVETSPPGNSLLIRMCSMVHILIALAAQMAWSPNNGASDFAVGPPKKHFCLFRSTLKFTALNRVVTTRNLPACAVSILRFP
jgi:hypothetical protein